MNKEIFIKMSSWSQLLFLCLFGLMGLILAFLATSIFSAILVLNGTFQDAASMMESTSFLRVIQLIQQLTLFLLPAILCVYLFNNKPAESLKVNTPINYQILLLSIMLLLVFQPIVSFTGYYNEQMHLPEFMSGIEVWMKNSEANAKIMMDRLMLGDSIVDYIIIFSIVAVTAAIVEEFLFRGVLQQIINKITGNYHIAVWIAAFIFSAIHFQFYGFIPRLLLGALLGYIFVWSNNIWVPVIIHLINNALSVIQYKLFYGTNEYENMQEIGVGSTWWITLLSIILSGVIFMYLSRMYTTQKRYSEIR